MRVTAALVSLALLAARAAPTSPPARLAAALADAVADTAQGRPVELAVPEDRTARGAGFALDVRALVLARLEGRVVSADSGPRLRVSWVVTEAAHRLVASARVVEEPGGRLVDLLSASAEADDGLLTLAPERSPATGDALDVVARTRTPPLDAPVLDLAFVDDDRLVVLAADAVALYRVEGTALVQESRQPLPGPLAAVRAPGGLIALAPREGALWVMTSRSPRAALFAIEGRRLVRRHDAAALPWPGCAAGLRYRPGTNLIEGEIATLGSGPFLALASGEQELAVLPDGRLRVAGADGQAASVRVGAALATPFRGLVAAPSGDPPGKDDAILLLARGAGLHVVGTLAVEGTVRALAARGQGENARLAAAADDVPGRTHLVLLDLRRREGSGP